MKTRIIVGVVGFVLLLLALFVLPPMILQIAFLLLGTLATYELLGATKLVKNHLLLLLCLLVSLLVGAAHLSVWPFALQQTIQLLCAVLLVGAFTLLLKNHEKMKVDEVAFAFFGAVLVPYLFHALTRIFAMPHGAVLVLLPLLAAWGADTCAYFAGVFFGRHKLAPVVSPKKTVEGAVGGVAGATVLVTVAVLLMNRLLPVALPVWAAVLLGVLGAGIGMVGDLSFSVIKRQVGIKDYGNLFPGHGGVLDRFDSVIFVAPVAEMILWLMK